MLDPQTRAQASDKPRLLISDRFGTYGRNLQVVDPISAGKITCIVKYSNLKIKSFLTKKKRDEAIPCGALCMSKGAWLVDSDLHPVNAEQGPELISFGNQDSNS
jgi:hypothetical protein